MSYPRSFFLLVALSLLAFGNTWAAPATEASSEPTWPQVISSDKAKLTVYQPQLDSWDGYTLNARAAVEATAADGKSTYGIVQFSAHTLVDKATRWVALDQYKIIKADFPADARQADIWVAALQPQHGKHHSIWRRTRAQWRRGTSGRQRLCRTRRQRLQKDRQRLAIDGRGPHYTDRTDQ